MRYFVQIENLRETYQGVRFGYIGMDVLTHEIHYFTFIDKDGIYHSNQLFAFNPNRIHSNILQRHWHFCSYRRENIQEDLPETLKKQVLICIKKHKLYNQKNGFPIQILEENQNYLSVQYKNNYSLFSKSDFSGAYFPFINQIKLTTEYDMWSRIDEEKTIDTLLHEIGHMKVSSYFLDQENRKLYTKIGFKNSIVYLEPILLPNGDVFFKTTKNKDSYESQEEEILEEMLNELECQSINQNYHQFSYPKYGYTLNQLCDGRLLKARYTNGIEEYYKSLISIIPNKDLATELLHLLVNLAYCYEEQQEEKNTQVLKLIQNYSKQKQCMK